MNTDQLITAAINQTLRNELPMVILTPDKHIIYANQPFADALGYTTEELVQLSHPDLCFSTFTEHPYYQTFWQQLLTGHAMQERTLRKAKDGHKVFFETTYTPYYDENGMITAIVNVSFNFNERAIELNQVFQTIKGFTDQINDIANNGTKQISDTITDVTKTQAFTTKNKVTSDTLLRETEQANDIITVIQDVAHQTRMLAVNSAIEAARLNEHGGSFTVISKEIRTLSNQVRE